MAERYSMKDDLFNARTVGQLAGEFAQAVPGFDPTRFTAEALAGFPDRELMARMDWLADCIEPHLAADFPTMADQLEAAMPARLDPTRADDDFGHFIHAVPGILAVRHGLEHHRARAMTLMYHATQRFSMEFYIRPFLNRWPEETLGDLARWAGDENYHVRRLVSEGTRPKLPWAKGVALTPDQTVSLLDRLHDDATRYVTRSVANHLNDLSKTHDNLVLNRLAAWQKGGAQTPKELTWMMRHALRTLIKQGHGGAMRALGFDAAVPVDVDLEIETPQVAMGEALVFACTVHAAVDLPVLVDYRISFERPGGKTGQKVFKLKQGQATPTTPFAVRKTHKLKGDATTFRLYPGRHQITVQVNGVDRAQADFDLT
ncbi:hypothetical protein [Roseobacter sp.]|uniref:hypothetical protein n=1 Tax=Roseobacter sp. TaxID=1907202 RepID=UPI003298E6E4